MAVLTSPRDSGASCDFVGQMHSPVLHRRHSGMFVDMYFWGLLNRKTLMCHLKWRSSSDPHRLRAAVWSPHEQEVVFAEGVTVSWLLRSYWKSDAVDSRPGSGSWPAEEGSPRAWLPLGAGGVGEMRSRRHTQSTERCQSKWWFLVTFVLEPRMK